MDAAIASVTELKSDIAEVENQIHALKTQRTIKTENISMRFSHIANKLDELWEEVKAIAGQFESLERRVYRLEVLHERVKHSDGRGNTDI